MCFIPLHVDIQFFSALLIENAGFFFSFNSVCFCIFAQYLMAVVTSLGLLFCPLGYLAISVPVPWSLDY